MALVQALIHIQKSKHSTFVICSDSLSALQAIEHLHIDNTLVLEIIQCYYHLILRHKNIVFCWVPSHVDIPGNEQADKAAKSALTLNVTPSKIPHSDYRQHIGAFIKSGWQSFWDEQINNKLYKIKPHLGNWPPTPKIPRRDQLVLTRAHIGHTYLTQGYLLRREECPMCVACMEVLSVDHILVHCTELGETRNNFYECETLQELFQRVNPDHVLKFIKAAGLYRYF